MVLYGTLTVLQQFVANNCEFAMLTSPARSTLHTVWVLLAATVLIFLPRQLQADAPERNMANVKITDQGSHLLVSWHFFYFLLPQQFALHEKGDEPISLAEADPSILEKNLREIAQTAFTVSVDGRVVEPALLSLTLYPNKSCLVLLSFPGHSGSKVDFRAPVLQYFPPAYFLSISFSSGKRMTGAYFGKQFPPVAHFVQGDVPAPPSKPLFSQDFIAEFGAAWVNYNWILSCVVLLLMRHPKQIFGLIATIVTCWIFLCVASTLFDYKLPFKVPQIALCIPTLLLCFICVKYPRQWALLTLVTLMAGLLNACYDIEQIPLSVPAQTANALAGLALGFAGGIALVLFVLIPLWWECRKYPGFEKIWAPKISWAVAALAVFLPIQKWIFG